MDGTYLCHDDQHRKARCYPVEIVLDNKLHGWGYIVSLLRDGRPVSCEQQATHVQARMLTGTLAGYVLTFGYFDGVLIAPTLH